MVLFTGFKIKNIHDVNTNKEIAITRFIKMITQGLKVQKPRKATRIPKSVIRKRLESKKKIATKKLNRKKPDVD